MAIKFDLPNHIVCAHCGETNNLESERCISCGLELDRSTRERIKNLAEVNKRATEQANKISQELSPLELLFISAICFEKFCDADYDPRNMNYEPWEEIHIKRVITIRENYTHLINYNAQPKVSISGEYYRFTEDALNALSEAYICAKNLGIVELDEICIISALSRQKRGEIHDLLNGLGITPLNILNRYYPDLINKRLISGVEKIKTKSYEEVSDPDDIQELENYLFEARKQKPSISNEVRRLLKDEGTESSKKLDLIHDAIKNTITEALNDENLSREERMEMFEEAHAEDFTLIMSDDTLSAKEKISKINNLFNSEPETFGEKLGETQNYKFPSASESYNFSDAVRRLIESLSLTRSNSRSLKSLTEDMFNKIGDGSNQKTSTYNIININSYFVLFCITKYLHGNNIFRGDKDYIKEVCFERLAGK